MTQQYWHRRFVQEQRRAVIEVLEYLLDIRPDCRLAASDVDAQAIGQAIVDVGWHLFACRGRILPDVAHVALGIATIGRNQASLYDVFLHYAMFLTKR